MSVLSPNARATDDMAGKTRLNDVLQREIEAAIKICGSIKTACIVNGVSWQTAKVWRKKGREGKQPYRAFVEACARAKAQRHLVLERVVFSAALKGDVRAAMYELDRRSAAQREQSRAAAFGNNADTVVLVYPVPVAEGAALQLLPGQALVDTTGEEIAREQDAEGKDHADD